MQDAAMRQQCVASTSGSGCSRAWRPCRASRRHLVPTRAVLDFNMWQTGDLPAGYKPPTVVPGARTLATPRLDKERVFQRLLDSPHPLSARHHAAFYSSVLGGITTEPGLMVLHAEDRMAHAGHAVYDVVPLVRGHLYQLDRHLARALAAAEEAGVAVAPSGDALKRILLDTAAASRKLNGHVLFWLSAGAGGFGPGSADLVEPSLFALVTTEFAEPGDFDRTKGWRARASPVEPPPEYFATFKNASGLVGAVAQLEAEANDCDVALFVDAEDRVLSGTTANLAVITPDHTFVYAPFERAPPGITVQTIAELIPQAMLIGSTRGVVGLTSLDGAPIGEGDGPGYMTLALQQVLTNHRDELDLQSGRHVRVPYGGLTGMPSQLV
ncbi:D-amino-acid chloroplastic-like [Raphidocelis subcapitata]|uniref:D-amino-acid chloroplastic-like n=1 Tax=Raphidocelis subcapitata TaxID=307507 RepID=A0A2V0PL61_9CHLO|nr:D-amino-acid chloroplastic-like [Raphidocelis subcapitata]|eukprot:GBF98067.1 D-amino-acid chloroplastic-like [Raphidocelis subcapitata]